MLHKLANNNEKRKKAICRAICICSAVGCRETVSKSLHGPQRGAYSMWCPK